MRITGVFLASLAAACLLLPSLAQGQEASFIVHMVKDPKAKWGGYTTVLRVDCGKVDTTAAKEQKLSCTVAALDPKTTCTDNCAFTQKSTDTPPFSPVFGWSTTNPTCVWVFDPWAQRYVYRCF